MKKKINFLINRSEITAGTRGASLGPDAILTAARAKKSTFFSRFDRETLPVDTENSLLDRAVKHEFAKRIEGLQSLYKKLSGKISNQLKQNIFPIVLAADHGSAGGTIAGIKAAFPNKRLGVIWIDAHGDLHTPYTTPSGNMHGMPLAIALDEDNLECRVNNVDKNTIKRWDDLKQIGFKGAKVLPENLVFIGVRDTEEQEDALMERLNIRNFTVQEVNELGTDETIKRVLERLSNCDLIYVSFDVDSMDPDATSYGTGTPVKNGLMPEQAKALLDAFGSHPKTVCVEVVEVNPCIDNKLNKMAEVTFDLIESMVNHRIKTH